MGLATQVRSQLGHKQDAEPARQCRLDATVVVIEHLPWHECFARYDRPGTLFYLDPPYWQTEGYGVEFPFDEYVRMAQLLRTMQGKAIVSINDHPAIREVFAGFEMIPLQIRYTIGAAESRGAPAGELIIKSWDDDQVKLI